MPIRVVLAEDLPLLRQGVVGLLDQVDDIEIVGTCGDYDALLELVERADPNVVVTDIRMPPTHTDEGIRAAAELRQRRADVGVVVLSQYLEPAYAVALFDQGSAGRAYLLKERVLDRDELVTAITEVASHGTVIDSAVVEVLVRASSRRHRSPLDHLSPRELDVLREVARGRTNAAIAEALFISDRSVDKHTNSIFSKLGLTEDQDVNRRVAAVLVFLEENN